MYHDGGMDFIVFLKTYEILENVFFPPLIYETNTVFAR